MLYSWFKILHIIFVMSWFAGLFYLPRIFVNLASEDNLASQKRLQLMAHKLYRFMSILAIPALGFGLALMIAFHFSGAWLHIKLTLVIFALIYHIYCGYILKTFKSQNNSKSHIWYRWFNEIPILLMLAITILVVIKPSF